MMINPQIFTMFDMTWVYNVRSCYVVVNMSTPFINIRLLNQGIIPKKCYWNGTPQLSSPEVTQGLTLHYVIHGNTMSYNLYQLANGVDGDLCNWFWESLSISRNRTCFRNLWSQLLIAHFLEYFLGNVPNLLSIAKFFGWVAQPPTRILISFWNPSVTHVESV